MTKKVLVSGCAGYIGSLLTKSLLDRGYRVIGVDSFIHNNQYAINGLIGPNFIFKKMDIRDSFFPTLAKEVDTVFHTAARVGAPLCAKDEQLTKEVNEDATISLVNSLTDQRLIYLCTNSGYGVSDDWCTEQSPLNPISAYGVTKVNGEKAVLNYKNSASLRLATVFGASIRPHMDLMVNNFTSELYFFKKMKIFEGHFRRNFVGINDVVRAMIWMLDPNYSGVYNCGNPDANLTKTQLAHIICDELGLDKSVVTDGEGKDPDGRDYLVSNKKLLDTRFEFRQSLRDGIQDIVTLCKLHGHDVMKYRNC